MQTIDTNPTTRTAYELAFVVSMTESFGRDLMIVNQLHEKGERSFSFTCDPVDGRVLLSSCPPLFWHRLPQMLARAGADALARELDPALLEAQVLVVAHEDRLVGRRDA